MCWEGFPMRHSVTPTLREMRSWQCNFHLTKAPAKNVMEKSRIYIVWLNAVSFKLLPNSWNSHPLVFCMASSRLSAFVFNLTKPIWVNMNSVWTTGIAAFLWQDLNVYCIKQERFRAHEHSSRMPEQVCAGLFYTGLLRSYLLNWVSKSQSPSDRKQLWIPF